MKLQGKQLSRRARWKKIKDVGKKLYQLGAEQESYGTIELNNLLRFYLNQLKERMDV